MFVKTLGYSFDPNLAVKSNEFQTLIKSGKRKRRRSFNK